MDLVTTGLLGLVAICAATVLSRYVRIAAPLLLVAVGIVVGLLPFVPVVEVEPELVLAGILPPLLYSAAVSMPATSFRREFGTIGVLSVFLVVASSVLLGLLVWVLVPDLGLGWAIALGAIVSPTDAVATAIVKNAGVSARVTAILEGEGLLNDATALVVLRTAIAATATGLSLGGAIGSFLFAVVVAVVIGLAVGHLNLAVRGRIEEPTVGTALSFGVPFLAAVPAEHLGASGLVAAVVAGLVTGQGAPRRLSPYHRVSDAQNWRTVELLLEGAIFLVMGLELYGLLGGLDGDEIGTAVVTALLVVVGCVVIRAAFMAPLLALLKRLRARSMARRPRFEQYVAELAEGKVPEAVQRRATRGGQEADPERVEKWMGMWGTRLRRAVADIDYFLATPLSWRDGTVVVWAGMRGAVTLAAAQTLPEDTPQRDLLVLVAFLVATFSLVLQGGTLSAVVRWVKPSGPPSEQVLTEQRSQLRQVIMVATNGERPGQQDGPGVVQWLTTQREALLDARDEGRFDPEVMEDALAVLDAEQIALRLRGVKEA
jgi:monovalent cation/hydrogen antiporter